MGINQHSAYTLAFYNIENLFDTENNPSTNDDDFLPWSKKRWTKKRYENKLLKIGNVISKIGEENVEHAPVIVGLAEVENKSVLNDLIKSEPLEPEDYGFVHYDSSDERGVDVALLYKKQHFKVTYSESFSVFLEGENGVRNFTRDILLVRGMLDNNSLSILVNHWSSRREGQKQTEHKRLTAAKRVNGIINDIKEKWPEERIVVMGDFNDNPNDGSLKLIEKESQLFNPFKTIWSTNKGSLNHDFEWHMFDQILCSINFLKPTKANLSFDKADVFDSGFLTQYHGRFKGQPFRTYVGKRYKGGYSDHFPVYINLRHR